MTTGILDAIDCLTGGCALCGRPRGESPSADFCSEDCQERWARSQTADPGGVNQAALVVEIEARHPRFMVTEEELKGWAFDVLTAPQICRHCGELIALVDLHTGGWGYLEFREVYQAEPGDWKIRTKWHVPDVCTEAVFRRDQGFLFEPADLGYTASPARTTETKDKP